MPRYKAQSFDTEQKPIKGDHVSVQEKGDTPHTEILDPMFQSWGKHILTGHYADISISYQAGRALNGNSRYSQVRRYYFGQICIGWVGISADGFRLCLHDGDCPTRIRDFADEGELHEFFRRALEEIPK